MSDENRAINDAEDAFRILAGLRRPVSDLPGLYNFNNRKNGVSDLGIVSASLADYWAAQHGDVNFPHWYRDLNRAKGHATWESARKALGDSVLMSRLTEKLGRIFEFSAEIRPSSGGASHGEIRIEPNALWDFTKHEHYLEANYLLRTITNDDIQLCINDGRLPSLIFRKDTLHVDDPDVESPEAHSWELTIDPKKIEADLSKLPEILNKIRESRLNHIVQSTQEEQHYLQDFTDGFKAEMQSAHEKNTGAMRDIEAMMVEQGVPVKRDKTNPSEQYWDERKGLNSIPSGEREKS